MSAKLTGRVRHRVVRRKWFGEPLLVLQVEEHVRFDAVIDTFHPQASSDAGSYTHWRDARIEDVTVMGGKNDQR